MKRIIYTLNRRNSIQVFGQFNKRERNAILAAILRMEAEGYEGTFSFFPPEEGSTVVDVNNEAGSFTTYSTSRKALVG